ncbi:MAG: hypothetical protein WBD20_20150 [Pirellulaceae bacterium]
MNAIRKVAIVSCGLAVSFLIGQSSDAQTRVIRTQNGSRSIRVIPSSSSRARTIAPSARSTSRYVPSRSTTPSGASTQVLANKPPEDAASIRTKVNQADDDIPESALLTERGMELAAQLKRLRYTEATLGSKHPSMASVREQIVSIKRILKSWGEADEEQSDAEPAEKEIVIVSEAVLDSLSKDDLKQLVVRLATDVSRLRQRLEELSVEELPADES